MLRPLSRWRLTYEARHARSEVVLLARVLPPPPAASSLEYAAWRGLRRRVLAAWRTRKHTGV